MDDNFHVIKRLPPYVFASVDALKMAARRRGEDIIDLGMGNPDGATPQHVVDKLVEAAQDPRNHRYSTSRGISGLRQAITEWYRDQHDVELDPDEEVIATIGSKDALAHGLLAVIAPGDLVIVPNPTYPIHQYGVVIAGGFCCNVRVHPDLDFFEELTETYRRTWPRPKLLILNFPQNPTAYTVDIEFFTKVVEFAKEHDLWVLHDFAYADIAFDGYRPPSFLQAPGAKDVGVEVYSLSKTYNMPGWRVGFCLGNRKIISALRRIKSYIDYGSFQPIQIAATHAIRGPREPVEEIRKTYQDRRDVLIDGLSRAGWEVTKPKASMFVWAKLPEEYRAMGSVKFAERLLTEAKVAVSPGIGFGDLGDDHVRMALVENEHRIRQATRGIRKFLNAGA